MHLAEEYRILTPQTVGKILIFNFSVEFTEQKKENNSARPVFPFPWTKLNCAQEM